MNVDLKCNDCIVVKADDEYMMVIAVSKTCTLTVGSVCWCWKTDWNKVNSSFKLGSMFYAVYNEIDLVLHLTETFNLEVKE